MIPESRAIPLSAAQQQQLRELEFAQQTILKTVIGGALPIGDVAWHWPIRLEPTQIVLVQPAAPPSAGADG